jgi:transposase
MTQDSMLAAGIDTAKDKLDVAITELGRAFTVANATAGWRGLGALLAAARVKRAAIEASGDYERGVVEHLRTAGVTVRVLQPLQSLPRRKPGSRPAPEWICAGPKTTRSMPR